MLDLKHLHQLVYKKPILTLSSPMACGCDQVFEAKQHEHRTESRRKLESTHLHMRTTLRDIYMNFKEGSGEVQREHPLGHTDVPV